MPGPADRSGSPPNVRRRGKSSRLRLRAPDERDPELGGRELVHPLPRDARAACREARRLRVACDDKRDPPRPARAPGLPSKCGRAARPMPPLRHVFDEATGWSRHRSWSTSFCPDGSGGRGGGCGGVVSPADEGGLHGPW